MANWTAERSAILSLMVEEVSGTEDIIATQHGNINHMTRMMQKTNIVRNDECYHLYSRLTGTSTDPFLVTRVITHLTIGILAGRFTMSLDPFVWRYHVLISNIPHGVPENLDAYKLRRLTHSNAVSFDISTCKLWYAVVSLMRTDYAACLSSVNDVLSQISPFSLYMSDVTL